LVTIRLLHLLRREAAVVPDHRDHRDVDVGEDVRRHAQHRRHADEDDEHRHHHERVRALQRDEDEPHETTEACGRRRGA